MKFVANASRVLVGIYFIFSGFVKVVDPYGTAIKLQEYFEVFAGDLPSFAGIFEHFAANSMALSIFMCCLELLVGIALLFSFRLKFTSWVMLIMLLFFTFLTFYSAYFNKVTDCGCFGEFLKLEPWPTFWKNIITLVFVLIIFSNRKNFKNSSMGTPAVLFASLISLGIGVFSMKFLPIVDFMNYKVGNNISDLTQIPDVRPVIEYQFFDKEVEKNINTQDYLMDTLRYEYISSKVLNEEDIKPVISDFSFSDTSGLDLTSEILTGTKLALLIKTTEDLQNLDFESYDKLRGKIKRTAVENIVLTSDSNIEDFLKSKNLKLPYFYGDEKLLKTMARNNPVLYLFKDGVVLGKWSFNNLPKESKIKKLINY